VKILTEVMSVQVVETDSARGEKKFRVQIESRPKFSHVIRNLKDMPIPGHVWIKGLIKAPTENIEFAVVAPIVDKKSKVPIPEKPGRFNYVTDSDGEGNPIKIQKAWHLAIANDSPELIPANTIEGEGVILCVVPSATSISLDPSSTATVLREFTEYTDGLVALHLWVAIVEDQVLVVKKTLKTGEEILVVWDAETSIEGIKYSPEAWIEMVEAQTSKASKASKAKIKGKTKAKSA